LTADKTAISPLSRHWRLLECLRGLGAGGWRQHALSPLSPASPMSFLANEATGSPCAVSITGDAVQPSRTCRTSWADPQRHGSSYAAVQQLRRLAA
jgi:hypothetical protein